jgi:predicted nucleic acid-binding protein
VTSIDTNVISALLEGEVASAALAENALLTAAARGQLLICAPVYAELIAKPKRSIASVEHFLETTHIAVDWQLEPSIWQSAGMAFQVYATNRKKQKLPAPRRIRADFLIGAHAMQRGYTLLTLDQRVYAKSFPKLRLETLPP